MPRRILPLVLGIFTCMFIILLAASSGTLGIALERTPTPEREIIATLASLMINGTEYARKVTEAAIPRSPVSDLATVRGKICYPRQQIPAMTIFFNNTVTQEQFRFESLEGQNTYSVQLPPGKYYAWSWVPQYQIGGKYSQFVACGMGENCIDYTPLLFVVHAGATITGIDICDWSPTLPTEVVPGKQR